MKDKNSKFPAAVVARILALILAGAGIFGWTTLPAEIWNSLRQPPALGILVFRLLSYAVVFLVCSWWLRAAWLGWHHQTASSIRWLCAALTTALVMCGIDLTAARMLDGAPQSIRRNVFDFFTVPLAAGLYLFLRRYLISRFELVDERSAKERRRSIEQGVGLVCVLLWVDGRQIVEDLIPKGRSTILMPDGRWGAVTFIGPLILAVILYKIGVRLLAPRQS